MTALAFEGVDEALRVRGVDIRLFGKPESFTRRRMGVVLAKGADVAQARARAQEAAAKIRPVSGMRKTRASLREGSGMKIGLIIIGDEILSGKRRDRHFAHVVSALAERGMELGWCRIIGAAPALISATLQQTFSRGDLVFCCGGIGATPDDYTRAAAAHAAGVALVRHPDAVAEIEARFGAAGLSPARLLLAELPAGSRIIPNPYN